MRFTLAFAIPMILGCTSLRTIAAQPATSTAPEKLTPTSESMVGSSTWFDEVTAAAARDPEMKLDSIRAASLRRVAELKWMQGRWTDHYRLFATPHVPEYRQDHPVLITPTRGSLWIEVRVQGHTFDVSRYLAFDAATKRWKRIEVGLPTYGSYAETPDDWKDGRLVFEYAMALEPYLGHALRQREIWSRVSPDEWTLTVEQELADGRFVFIEESHFTRADSDGPLSPK